MSAAGTYRSDIDGLRAVSVLLVLLFHANLGVPGGFIGVDVFFVISGFLITKILASDYDDGRWSVIDFYRRRAVRILPALAAVILFCMAVGWAIMLPTDLNDMGRSVLAAALFVANFHFYGEAGYFSGPAHEKPLLHTWSLSVEEQFYLLWPVVCFMLILRLKREHRAMAAAALAVASFVYACMRVGPAPDAAFFLPLSRAWELLAGAAVALGGYRLKGRLGEALAILSLLVIVASGFLLNSKSEVPGMAALPTILAAVVLVSSAQGTFAGRLLSWPALRATGLISYSLYLWHWPLLAFATYYAERALEWYEGLVILLLAFATSAASWRWIEQPVRNARAGKMRVLTAAFGTVAAVCFASLGLMQATSLAAKQMSPVAQRALDNYLAINPLETACHIRDLRSPNLTNECRFGAKRDGVPDVVVIGDSHADHLVPAVAAASSSLGMVGFQITHSGCLPMWNVEQFTNGKLIEDCARYRRDAAAFIDTLPPGRIVVLAARWSFYAQTVGPGIDVPYYAARDDELSVAATRAAMISALRETVDDLTSRGHAVVVVDQVPEYPVNPIGCYTRYAERPNAGALCGDHLDSILEVLGPARSILREAVRPSPTVELVDPSERLCPDGRCTVAIEDTFLYRDLHHLNAIGSETVAPMFIEPLTRMRRGLETDIAASGS